MYLLFSRVYLAKAFYQILPTGIKRVFSDLAHVRESLVFFKLILDIRGILLGDTRAIKAKPYKLKHRSSFLLRFLNQVTSPRSLMRKVFSQERCHIKCVANLKEGYFGDRFLRFGSDDIGVYNSTSQIPASSHDKGNMTSLNAKRNFGCQLAV